MMKNPTFWISTLTAARGFRTLVQQERKIRLALAVTVIVIGLAVWLRTSYLETLLLLVVCIQVIVGETVNTSLEKAMDYASGMAFHPLIKRGKDYAAASVFLLSVLASIVSLVILARRYFSA